MAHTIPFDTHAFIKELQTAGLSENQAEVQAMALTKALAEFQESYLVELATKQDLREMELRLKHDLAVLKHDLTVRLGSMMVVGVSLVVALMKLL